MNVELKLAKKSESPDRLALESGHPEVFALSGFRVCTTPHYVQHTTARRSISSHCPRAFFVRPRLRGTSRPAPDPSTRESEIPRGGNRTSTLERRRRENR